jgi:hypothetical protein
VETESACDCGHPARIRMRYDLALTMKKRLALSFVLCLGLTLMFSVVPVLTVAADGLPIVGDWGGTLDPGAQPKKRVIVHISATQDETLSGTIDYPDQDTSGIQITAITYEEPTLHFESSSGLDSYDGTMNKDHSKIAGAWKQGGTSLSLILKRVP